MEAPSWCRWRGATACRGMVPPRRRLPAAGVLVCRGPPNSQFADPAQHLVLSALVVGGDRGDAAAGFGPDRRPRSARPDDVGLARPPVRLGPSSAASATRTRRVPAAAGTRRGRRAQAEQPMPVYSWASVPRRCSAGRPTGTRCPRWHRSAPPAGQVLLRLDEGVPVVLAPRERDWCPASLQSLVPVPAGRKEADDGGGTRRRTAPTM